MWLRSEQVALVYGTQVGRQARTRPGEGGKGGGEEDGGGGGDDI